MDQAVVPPPGFPSASVQSKAAPPQSCTSMPRCRLYQACIAFGSLALKKMPPIPVTRFMCPSCAKMSILTWYVSFVPILLLTRLLCQDAEALPHEHERGVDS